jgi:hypothetical protein
MSLDRVNTLHDMVMVSIDKSSMTCRRFPEHGKCPPEHDKITTGHDNRLHEHGICIYGHGKRILEHTTSLHGHDTCIIGHSKCPIEQVHGRHGMVKTFGT